MQAGVLWRLLRAESENDDTVSVELRLRRGEKSRRAAPAATPVWEFFGGRLAPVHYALAEKLRMAIDAGVDGILF